MKNFFVLVAVVTFGLLVVSGVAAARRLGDLPSLVQVLNGSPTGGDVNLSIPSDAGFVSNATAYNGGETLLIFNDHTIDVYCDSWTGADAGVTAASGVPIIPDEKFYWTLRHDHRYLNCGGVLSEGTVRVRTME